MRMYDVTFINLNGSDGMSTRQQSCSTPIATNIESGGS